MDFILELFLFFYQGLRSMILSDQCTIYNSKGRVKSFFFIEERQYTFILKDCFLITVTSCSRFLPLVDLFQYGISGPFWYAAGASIQMLLFSMVSVQLKIRAPGAKTFLQVIKARFGTRTHKIFCGFALMTNLVVTAMLMLGAISQLSSDL